MNIAELTFRPLDPPPLRVPKQDDDTIDSIIESQRYELIGRMCSAVAARQANLLTVLLGRMDRRDDARRMANSEELNRLRQSAEAAANLTRSVLDACGLSRDADLTGSMACAADLFAIALPAGVRLVRIFEPIGPSARPVPGLGHAVLNLLHNATDSLQGSGDILLRLRSILPDRGRPLSSASGLAGPGYEISIQDSGDGIVSPALDRLGQPGYSTKPGHTGLGRVGVSSPVAASGPTGVLDRLVAWSVQSISMKKG